MEAVAEKCRNAWYNGRILNNCSNAPDITHLTTYKNFREESFKKKYYILNHTYLHVETNGNSLQYSCLVNPMDGGNW